MIHAIKKNERNLLNVISLYVLEKEDRSKDICKHGFINVLLNNTAFNALNS